MKLISTTNYVNIRELSIVFEYTFRVAMLRAFIRLSIFMPFLMILCVSNKSTVYSSSGSAMKEIPFRDLRIDYSFTLQSK